MKEDQQFSNDPIENEHLNKYIEKKVRKNSRLRVGRKNKEIKKYRRRLIFKTALPLCLFFIIIALISGYFVSPYSKVKNISIEALQDQNQLKNNLPIQVGDSLMMVKLNEPKVIKLVKQNDINVKNVKINWKGHNEAILKIKFYDFYAYFKHDGHYYPVNDRGETVKQPASINIKKNVLILQGFSNKKRIKTTLLQYEKLPNDLKADVKEVKKETAVDDPQKVKVYLNDGNQVVLQNDQLAKKMAYYPSIKTTLKRPSVVNMEYGAYATPIK